MNLGLMTYDDGILTINSGTSKMYFPIDEEGAGKIMKCVRQAYKTPDDFMNKPVDIQKRMAELEGKNTREAALEYVKLDGYIEIMHVDGITLFVKCVMQEWKLFAFKYISDCLPNTHGSTQVNITMQI